MPSSTQRVRLRIAPLVADLVCLLAFSFGGKSSHEAGESDWVVLAIVWPYAVALLITHLWLAFRGRSTSRPWPEGVAVVVVTYALGMVLRAISGRGIAVGFLVVAAIFLTVTMLGWRTAGQLLARRRVERRVDRRVERPS